MKKTARKVKYEGGLPGLFLALLKKLKREYGSEKIPTALARHYICSRLNIPKRKFREIMRATAERYNLVYSPKFIRFR